MTHVSGGISVPSAWLLIVSLQLFIGGATQADQAHVERTIADSPVLNVRFGGWTIDTSLVPGIFVLQPPSGKFAPVFFQETTGRVGSLRGWQEVTPGGLQALGPELARELRQQIVSTLDWQRGIKTVYGTGKQSALLFSAFDCPNCRRFEQRLTREGARLNATLYLFPQTLHANDAQRAEIVTRIWCGSDPRTAWTRALHDQYPSAQPATDCKLSNRAATELSDMLGVYGVPALVTRQGTVLYGFVDQPLPKLSRALER
jgi:hypothetical protein